MSSHPTTFNGDPYTTALKQLGISAERLRQNANYWEQKSYENLGQRDHFKSSCHTLRLRLDEAHSCRVVLHQVVEFQNQRIRGLESEVTQLRHFIASRSTYGSEYGHPVEFGPPESSAGGLLPSAIPKIHDDSGVQDQPGGIALNIAGESKVENQVETGSLQMHRPWSVMEAERGPNGSTLQTTQSHESPGWTTREA